MKRLFLAAALGACITSLSFGQELQKDTTATADTVTTAVPADTSKPALDTTAVRLQPAPISADTLSAKAKDSVAVRKDTTVQTIPEKKSTMPEMRSESAKSGSLDPYGYKDVHWGMTFRDVRDYLVDNDHVDEYDIQGITNGFEYPGTVAGVKATIAYQFDNDRLYIVRVAPKVKAVSRFDFLDSFEEYQSTLEVKYGKPTRSGFHKIDEQYLNTIESIQFGFAKKYALWEFERSYIVLVLAGHNKRLELHITYVSRAIFDELKDRKENLKLEDF